MMKRKIKHQDYRKPTRKRYHLFDIFTSTKHTNYPNSKPMAWVAFPRNDGKFRAYSASRTDVPRPMEIRNILTSDIDRI
jgi:hypothetical protein